VEIALVQTFADQAVIAIENVRLFNETKRRCYGRLPRPRCSKSSANRPPTCSRCCNTIAERAARLTGAQYGLVFRYDGEWIHAASSFGVESEGMGDLLHRFPMRPTAPRFPRGQFEAAKCQYRRPAGRIGRRLPPSMKEVRPQSRFPKRHERADAARPACHRGHQREPGGTGALRGQGSAAARDVRRQAVIAIENVRLFNETKEALEQKTATSEVLQAISNSVADAAPVFETIVRSAVLLCDSMFANVLLFDGELLHFAESSNAEPEFPEARARSLSERPDTTQIAGRVIIKRSVVVMEDALVDADYARQLAVAGRWRGCWAYRCCVREAARRDRRRLGATGPVSKVHEELLKTFADQAVIAIREREAIQGAQEAAQLPRARTRRRARFSRR
jgi:hypothetical protein